MKSAGAIIFALILAFAASSYAFNNIWGSITPGHKVIHIEQVFNVSSANGFFRNVRFPSNGNRNKNRISGIHAIDYVTNSSNVATLTAGGPGQVFAWLEFQAKPRTSLNYAVIFYGRDYDPY